ncbi:sigma-70 family RNA polymerase sigma factor [Paenibacillus humicola]|uniref:sigma-70 family RNA polymerase sigma factor n=1 Tax=Paenibacillus humicola TaxID=3110540 RepID=UPI00237C13C8|nr:sigma-70 family RNA polymerase sigma factor [Paenibacillus humicola]
MDVKRLYEEYRPLLFSIAYRMLGLRQDAEDIVQDTFAALQQQPPGAIDSIRAYLCKTVTNRCMNELKSARRTRVSYIGPWLPEPIALRDETDPSRLAERQDEVSYAYLVLLEALSPAERAVFVLRETLGFPFEDIAALLGKSPANCRKLFSRGRIKLDRYRNGLREPAPSRQPELAAAFARAFGSGDARALVQLLADDCILLSDGGGKVKAAINPLYGKDRVLALLTFAASRSTETRIEPAVYAGGEGFRLIREGRKTADYILACAPGETVFSRIYIVMNPDKLAPEDADPAF